MESCFASFVQRKRRRFFRVDHRRVKERNGHVRLRNDQTKLRASQQDTLCAASDEAEEIRDDISFFQALQATLNKKTIGGAKTPEQLDAAIRQME